MRNDRLNRETQGNSYHLIFNFQRLVKCLEEAIHEYINGSLNNQPLPRTFCTGLQYFTETLESSTSQDATLPSSGRSREPNTG